MIHNIKLCKNAETTAWLKTMPQGLDSQILAKFTAHSANLRLVRWDITNLKGFFSSVVLYTFETIDIVFVGFVYCLPTSWIYATTLNSSGYAHWNNTCIWKHLEYFISGATSVGND